MRTNHLVGTGSKVNRIIHTELQNKVIHIIGNKIVANFTKEIKLTNTLIYSVIFMVYIIVRR